MEVETVDGQHVRDTLEHVLSSATFARSDRVSKLLRFLVERHLEGRDEELKESLIGVEVFGRKPGYDPKLDSTVRTASFALTNMLAGLGRDFATSERVVGLVTGVGLIVAGVVGSLAVPRLIIAIPPRVLYVLIGTAGALFTFMLLTLARTSTTFALAVFGENTFQSAVSRTGDAPVALTGGSLRDPEVDQARSHRRELRHL
jgi:hypothetical protein